MSYIALLFCLVFIIFCLYYDQKKLENVSSAIWIPVIWCCITASRSISSIFYPISFVQNDYNTGIPLQYDITESNPLERNVLIVLMVIGIFILVQRKINWSLIIKNNIWIFLFFFFMGLSFIWSQFPVITLKRWFRSIGDIIMVLIIITENNPFEAIKSILKRSAYFVLPLSLITIFFFPELGKYYLHDDQLNLIEMWTGITTHKNMLGIISSYSGLIFIIDLLNNWKNKDNRTIKIINILFILLSLFLLVGSKSTTSLVVLILGTVLYIVLSFAKSNIKKIRKIIVSIIIVLISIQLFYGMTFNSSLFEKIVGFMGKDVTLTGRTDLWALLIEIGLKKPFLGYGFGAFWGGDVVYYIWTKFLWGPLEAHNGYINVFISLGFIGLAILIMIIIKSYIKIENIFIEDHVYGKTLIIFFVLILIHNITEVSFASPTSYLWYLFLIISMAASRKQNIIYENENKILLKEI
jgi:exopolysaccharide production protein ExoQ